MIIAWQYIVLIVLGIVVIVLGYKYVDVVKVNNILIKKIKFLEKKFGFSLSGFDADNTEHFDFDKNKIMSFLEKYKTISSHEVERILGVSDLMAVKYLEVLEKEGQIAKIGKSGETVFYVKNEYIRF
ncbi:MAG: FaeA/PapI family transcriptional regulator [Candidatus Pacebacteria bacterium]|nr:FaeA/PapI family transcriptional regulator [Candidatus Paceibacterota bacterium]